jgi:hypothetical protein
MRSSIRSNRGSIHVDTSRLIVEWIIATVIFVGLYFAPLKLRAGLSITTSHRIGFQRLYAVLAVLWIGAALFTILSHRWQPWLSFQPDYTALAMKNGGTISVTPDPNGGDIFDLLIPTPSTSTVSLWAAGLSLLPPLLGYSILFVVFPWVYRGFRPETQN